MLLGGGSGVRTGVIHFAAGSSSGTLCFNTSDNEIVCERDVIGIIRLINTSLLQVDEPSTATVRIKDDDGRSQIITGLCIIAIASIAYFLISHSSQFSSGIRGVYGRQWYAGYYFNPWHQCSVSNHRSGYWR